MLGKIFIILTNLSSIITLYYGLKNKEYTIMYCIISTSILSLIFHLFTEFPLVNHETLSFFRLLDFYYSYKSIYVVSTNFLTNIKDTDNKNFNLNYDIVVSPVLLIMSKFLTNKNYFLISIIPLCVGIILPYLIYHRNHLIKINFRDIRFCVCFTLILTNIIFYIMEKNIDYYIFHSVHHLLCFSYPGLLIQLKYNSINKIEPNIIIPSINNLSNISNVSGIQNISNITNNTNITNIKNIPTVSSISSLSNIQKISESVGETVSDTISDTMANIKNINSRSSYTSLNNLDNLEYSYEMV